MLSGNLDCAPIPSGGAQAALSGAKIMYIVGESLKSQWTITTRQDIAKPEDLKGKTLGLGRPGGADYDEAQAVLHRFFHMDAGKDYKVISFQGEPSASPPWSTTTSRAPRCRFRMPSWPSKAG